MLVRLCSKSFKLGFSSAWTENFQMYKLGFEEVEDPETQDPSTGLWRKQGNYRKTSNSCFMDYTKAFVCVDHNTTHWKVLKEMEFPDHLTCPLRNMYVGQEATVRTRHGTIGSKFRKECDKAVCCHPAYLTHMHAEYMMWNARLNESQAGIKIGWRNTNNLRYADDTTLMTESEEKLKSLFMRVKEVSSQLELNIQKTKIMVSCPIISWQLEGDKVRAMTGSIFLGS